MLVDIGCTLMYLALLQLWGALLDPQDSILRRRIPFQLPHMLSLLVIKCVLFILSLQQIFDTFNIERFQLTSN